MATTPHIYTLEKNWDYRQPAIYFVTLVVRNRRPILGTLVGGIDDARVEPTRLGWQVTDAFTQIPQHHPKMRILGRMVMPDHFHAIVQVTAPMEKTLGQCLRGWKLACNMAYKAENAVLQETTLSRDAHPASLNQLEQRSSDNAAASIQEGRCDSQGCPAPMALFEESFFPRRLMGKGQLQAMFAYMRDNPRRLAIKQATPMLFCIHRGEQVAGYALDAIGNRALLCEPMIVVHVRRRWTAGEARQFKNHCIAEARKGVVLISPFISEDERAVRDVALQEGLRMIVICDHGFGELYKPEKMYFNACARGQVLLLSPWKYCPNPPKLTREQCNQMNEMAERIAGDHR